MSTVEAGSSFFSGEYVEHDDPDADIQQGDILEFIPRNGEREEWDTYFGVIVTANCDLFHGKHGGILSYVPVVPIDSYTRAVILPRLINSEEDRARRQFKEILPTSAGWPTAERLIEMIELGEGLDAAIESIPDDEYSSEVERDLKRVSVCGQATKECVDSESVQDAIAAVTRMQQQLREIDGHEPLKPRSLRNDLASRLTKALPGDALFLDRVSPVAVGGHIAYLRLIREISHDSIATSPVGEKRMAMKPVARRIGRLKLVYQHRLAQQMARVFTDIGLPETYERNWSEVVDKHTQAWGDLGTAEQDATEEHNK